MKIANFSITKLLCASLLKLLDVLTLIIFFLKVAFLTFLTYTLSSDSHVLTPQIAFVSLTLFNQLRSPMTMIAFLIQQIVQVLK